MKQLMLLVLVISLMSLNRVYGKELVGDSTKPFSMRVDEVNFITGAGVAVTGTVSEGTIKPGLSLELGNKGSSPVKVTVVFISMYTKQVPAATRGDHITVVIKGVSLENVKKGMLLTGETATDN